MLWFQINYTPFSVKTNPNNVFPATVKLSAVN